MAFTFLYVDIMLSHQSTLMTYLFLSLGKNYERNHFKKYIFGSQCYKSIRKAHPSPYVSLRNDVVFKNVSKQLQKPGAVYMEGVGKLPGTAGSSSFMFWVQESSFDSLR